jgi:putative transcriptional regulator
MLKDNLKTLRKNKGLSQEELSIKLNVVRQTISKWETGLSVPDAEMLVTISELFETPVSEILGESIEEKETNDLKVISEKLEVINEQLSISQKQKRKRKIMVLLIIDICLIFFFVLLALSGSPYLTWDYGNPEWSVIGTLWHSFEWIFFRIAPLLIIIITVILIILFIKREK